MLNGPTNPSPITVLIMLGFRVKYVMLQYLDYNYSFQVLETNHFLITNIKNSVYMFLDGLFTLDM